MPSFLNRAFPSRALLCAVCLAAAPPAALAANDARPMLKVDPGGRYRAVYDIHADTVAAGVSRGLYYARGLVEAFGKQGVKPAQLDVHLVLHGDAAQFLLGDDAWQRMQGDPFAVNLNARIVQALIELGMHVEICHSTMKSKGWTPDDVLPGVAIVHDGYTRLIELQNDGYPYIGGF